MKSILKKVSASFLLLAITITFHCGETFAESHDAPHSHSSVNVSHHETSIDDLLLASSDQAQEDCHEGELEMISQTDQKSQKLASGNEWKATAMLQFENQRQLFSGLARGSPSNFNTTHYALRALKTDRLIS